MAEALTNDAVMNLSWYYSNQFDVWEVGPDLIGILERYGHNKYYIYIETKEKYWKKNVI